MNKTLLLISIPLMLLGAAIFIFGGWDDSPGAQGIGALVIFLGVGLIWRSRKKQ
jgi:hypothetical protein